MDSRCTAQPGYGIPSCLFADFRFQFITEIQDRFRPVFPLETVDRIIEEASPDPLFMQIVHRLRHSLQILLNQYRAACRTDCHIAAHLL